MNRQWTARMRKMRLSTSRSQNPFILSWLVGIINESNSIFKKSEYSYLQYHWCPIALIVKLLLESENEEERQLQYVKQVYEHCYTRFSSFSTLYKYRCSFLERHVQDDSTNNIIPGHCGVFLFFFLALVSIRYTPGHKLVRDTFTLGHPQIYLLLLLFFFLFLYQFFPVGRWYNETGLLVIFPATVSVCFGALRSSRSNLLYFNHSSGFFALSREGEQVLSD